MIMRIGNIGLKADILGNTTLGLEREFRNAFSEYLSPSYPWDLSLEIYILPEIHLDGILLEEEKEAVRHILEKMQRRFPYAIFPYEWVTGVHGKASHAASRPQTLPGPFIDRPRIDQFSVVPLRQCLLALNHLERHAVALVRGKDTTLLTKAVTLALQAVFCLAAPANASIMLHSASAAIDGYGYLFLGVSGAGKSTMAGNFPRENVFSDETTLCFLDQGMPWLAPTPFTQVVSGSVMAESASLKKIFFLKKGKENALTELSPGTAMARILHNHIHFFSFMRKQEALKAFHAVEGMVRHAPAYILCTTPDFEPLSLFEETRHERKKAL